MEATASLGLLIAFTAGVLSFLSPCVLPLVPSYVGFITGLGLESVHASRRVALVHALLFVAGFSLIFLLLGATATALGRALLAHREWISRAGGVLVILFGLHLLGITPVRALGVERRVQLATKPLGYLGTVLVGIAFGAGWTPCIGPILGSILIYTSSQADLARGLALLSMYSLGLALPFVASALAVDHLVARLARVGRQLVWVNRAGGALLIFVGVLLITDYFTLLASYLQALTPAALRGRL